MSDGPDWTEAFQLTDGTLTVVASSEAGEASLIFRPIRPYEAYIIGVTDEMQKCITDASETSRGGPWLDEADPPAAGRRLRRVTVIDWMRLLARSLGTRFRSPASRRTRGRATPRGWGMPALRQRL
jgi:hypothetical protein